MSTIRQLAAGVLIASLTFTAGTASAQGSIEPGGPTWDLVAATHEIDPTGPTWE